MERIILLLIITLLSLIIFRLLYVVHCAKEKYTKEKLQEEMKAIYINRLEASAYRFGGGENVILSSGKAKDLTDWYIVIAHDGHKEFIDTYRNGVLSEDTDFEYVRRTHRCLSMTCEYLKAYTDLQELKKIKSQN